MYKVGIGYDIHRLEENRKLIIGGVTIPYNKGLSGHSDADVLIHAIIDAFLGASGLSDIGTLFPDTDNKYKDINSVLLLEHVVKLIKDKGFRINNVDSNIIAQAPKMMPYIPQMKEIISTTLNINIKDVSIKAKTKEGMDSVGKNLAIESNAVVLLEK